MSFAETAPLIAQLDLKGNFAPNLKKAQGALTNFANKFDGAGQRFERAGRQIGTGIRNIGKIAAVGIAALATQVAAGLHSLIELEQAQAQTAAVLKSTGQQAGITGVEVTRLSEKFEALNATVGDEFVRAGANMLLTFTNIRGKAFEPALEAILNMNTAMGKGPEGLTNTAIQVGKALNDPIKGIGQLRRVGIAFTEQQIKQIKKLQEQNDLYGAQQIILAELNKEFGGSFAAQGGTTAGKVAKFTDSIEDLQRVLAEALLPTLGNVADALSKTLQDESVVAGVRDFGKALAGLVSPANLATAGRILGDVFSAAKSAAPVIAAAAKTMFSVVSAAVGVFSSLPKEIQQLAIGAFAINKLTGGLVTNIAGGLIGAVLKQLVSGVVNVSGGVVNVVGAGGLAGAAAGGTGILSKVSSLILPAAIATAIIAAAVPIGEAFASALPAELKGPGGRGESESQRRIREGREEMERKRRERESRIFGPPEPFGPPAPRRPTRPGFVDSPRTSPADLKALEAILTRGRAAGFKPTLAAAQATNQKNLERLAAAQLVKSDAIKNAIQAGDTRSELAGIRSAVASQSRALPVTNVKVEVNVTAAAVNKSVTIQKRYGPSGGSRDQGQGSAGWTGGR